jgi:hypothetical protein
LLFFIIGKNRRILYSTNRRKYEKKNWRPNYAQTGRGDGQGRCGENHHRGKSGLKTFFRYLQSAQKLNADLRLDYILPTMYDRRTRQSRQILQQVQKYFARQICDPIQFNVRLSEAPSHGQTIFEYEPHSAGAIDYQKLMRRVEKNGDPQKRNT